MKKLGILMAKGFEEIEALIVADFCKRAGIEVELISTTDKMSVESTHGIKVKCDKLIWDAKVKKYNAIYLPGGLPGAENLRDSEEVHKFLSKAVKEEILIAALCASPMVLDSMDLLKEGKYTCYPGIEEDLKVKPNLDATLVKDGKIWTGMGPMLAPQMAFALIEELVGKEKAEEIKEETLFNRLINEVCQ